MKNILAMLATAEKESRGLKPDETARILRGAGEQRGEVEALLKLEASDVEKRDGLKALFDDAEQRSNQDEARRVIAGAPAILTGKAKPEVRYGLPLDEERSFADVAGVQAATASEFGNYVRSVMRGEVRAQSEGTGNKGGYLVPTEYAAGVLDLARNKTAVARAGASIYPMSSNTLKVTKVVGDAVPAWRNEAAVIGESDMTFGEVTFTARSLAVLVKASLEVVEDAPNFGDILTKALAEQFGIALDQAALYGSGVAPTPQGVYTASGVTSTEAATNGAAPTWDMLIDGVARLEAKNYTPSGIIVAPRTEAGLAKQRENGTTGPYLVAPEYVSRVARYSTNGVKTNQTQGTAANKASDAFIADWSQGVGIGMRTDFRILPMREAFLANGQIGFVGWLRADVQTLRPEAIEVIKGLL
ncbi:phage major capsid protein [Micromonospora sp. SL1-18]|uniref:phage major capsid protein n=1 Tax=Micromonospora sp. SL1-18 TaxID=3399128 RepID=UPI003A4D66BB